MEVNANQFWVLLVFICIPVLVNYIYNKIIKENKNNKINYLINIFFSNSISMFIFHYILKVESFSYSAIDYCKYILCLIISSVAMSIVFSSKKSEVLDSLTHKLKNLNNLKWTSITFVILIILMLAVSPKIIFEPWIMVEDGTVFLNQQFRNGLMAIFNPYGGYCILLSRLSAFVSAHLGKITNSIVVTVMTLKWITIIFDVLVVNYINDESNEWISKNKITRLIFSILVMYLMGNFQFFFYNTTSAHWFCGLFCFLVGINIITRKELPKLYLMPLIFISILSSPSGLTIGFAILYYFICMLDWKKIISGTYKNLGLKNLFKLFIIGIALLLQILFILLNGSSNSNEHFSLLGSILKSLLLTLQTPIYMFGVNIALKFNDIIISSAFGAIMIVITFIVLYKNKKSKIFWYAFGTIFCLYFMTLYKNSNLNYYITLYQEKYWLYNALPATICSFILYLAINEIVVTKKIKHIWILYIIVFCFLCQHLYIYSYEFTDNIWNIEDNVDFNSDTYEPIPIFPGGEWYLNVPVTKE